MTILADELVEPAELFVVEGLVRRAESAADEEERGFGRGVGVVDQIVHGISHFCGVDACVFDELKSLVIGASFAAYSLDDGQCDIILIGAEISVCGYCCQHGGEYAVASVFEIHIVLQAFQRRTCEVVYH